MKIPHHITLYDSSVQDTKFGERSGSTLVMATTGTFIKVGDKLLEIMQEDNKKQKSLRHVKFIDIGGGLCTGVIGMKKFHHTNTVTIEQSLTTFRGSICDLENFSKKVSLLLIFKFIILKLYLYSNIIIFDILQEPGVLPFYPIYGDANKLNNFGGA